MKILKMSLVAAVTVAGLSTVAFADEMMMSGTKVSASADFRWKTTLADEKADKMSGWTRDRVNVDFKSKSSDAMGSAHLQLRVEKGTAKATKAYVKYSVAGVTLGMGPIIGTPGLGADGANREGLTVMYKVGPATINAGILTKGSMMSTEIVDVTVNAGPATIQGAYQMGDDAEYLALVANAKVGPAKVGFGYAKNNKEDMDDMSVLGFTAEMSTMGATIGGGYTMAGDMGSVGATQAAPGDRAHKSLGSYYGAGGKGAKTFYVDASYKIMGIKLGTYFTSTSDTAESEMMAYQVSAVKALNKQTTLKVYYTQKDNKATDPDATLEVRLAAKM